MPPKRVVWMSCIGAQNNVLQEATYLWDMCLPSEPEKSIDQNEAFGGLLWVAFV